MGKVTSDAQAESTGPLLEPCAAADTFACFHFFLRRPLPRLPRSRSLLCSSLGMFTCFPHLPLKRPPFSSTNDTVCLLSIPPPPALVAAPQGSSGESPFTQCEFMRLHGCDTRLPPRQSYSRSLGPNQFMKHNRTACCSVLRAGRDMGGEHAASTSHQEGTA